MKSLFMVPLVLLSLGQGVQAALKTSESRALIAYMQVKPGTEARYLKLAETVILESRREPGTIEYQLHQSVKNPQQFVFYEIYESHEALEEHRNSPHVKAFLRETAPITVPGQFILEEYALKGDRE